MSGPLNGSAQRITPTRSRKEASKRLGIALAADHRRLLEATSNEEVQQAAIVLGQNFNTNIEFICWVLKEYGGVQQMPFQPQFKAPRAPMPAANDLPKLATDLTGVVPAGECTCPPPEPGIIQARGHMTSCPKYEP